MNLYQQWHHLIESQTEETFQEFWKEYSEGETKIYSSLLDNPEEVVTGTIQELADKYEVRPVIFMGFLDGIDNSLRESNGFKYLDEGSMVTLDMDLEKLYFNMLSADADYLFNLPHWQTILSDEKREEIIQEYKHSRTVIKEKKIGRNEPCPCGSGLKYKKCCGR